MTTCKRDADTFHTPRWKNKVAVNGRKKVRKKDKKTKMRKESKKERKKDRKKEREDFLYQNNAGKKLDNLGKKHSCSYETQNVYFLQHIKMQTQKFK